ncbi:MAG: glycosyltransferase family 2 protein [Fidelibacterota bacterium]
MPSLSVVVPVFNEAESIPELFRELQLVLAPYSDYEIVFVDDGSWDGSGEICLELAQQNPSVKLIQFYRNYGKAAALSEGFKYAHGEVIITMDADLQDDPHEIPNLLAKLEEGFDLVSGWKKKRLDPINKRWPSKLFNFVVRTMTGVHIHDFNCGLKAYRQSVVRSIELYGGRHRYIPALAGDKRFRITEIIVNHRPRKYGRTKYGGSRLFHGFFDLLTIMFLNRYTQSPLHLFGLLGLFSFFLGVLVEGYVVVLKYGYGEPFQKHFAMLLFGALVIILGMWSFSLGLIAEMIARIQQDQERRVKRIIPEKVV